jgi:hypothetical protein
LMILTLMSQAKEDRAGRGAQECLSFRSSSSRVVVGSKFLSNEMRKSPKKHSKSMKVDLTSETKGSADLLI